MSVEETTTNPANAQNTAQNKKKNNRNKTKKENKTRMQKSDQGTRLAREINVSDKMIPLDSLLFVEGFWGV